MLTYSEAKSMMLKARHGRRKLKNNTWLEERHRLDGKPVAHTPWPDYAVRLHSTDVVTLHPDGSYTLNSGGWRTVTTKDRINRYSPIPVYSNRGAWMVGAGWLVVPAPARRAQRSARRAWLAVPFADGMRIYPDGKVEGAGADESHVRRAILKQIRAYVDGFARHVAKHGLDAPDTGDCWGCHMVPADTSGKGRSLWGQDKAVRPGADHVFGVDHIFSHFEERYYVPSLVWRAVQRRGNPQVCYQLIQADAKRGDTRMLKHDLRYYLKSLMPALVAYRMGEVGRAA